MKVSIALAAIVGLAAVQAVPSPEPTAAPLAKRQVPSIPSLDSLTDAAALSSLSGYLNSQFSQLYSQQPDASSFIAQAQSSANSYLSVANGLLTISDKAEPSRSASAVYNSILSDMQTGGAAATPTASKQSGGAAPSQTAASSGGSNAAVGGWEAAPVLTAFSAALVGAVAVLAL